jgi:hypothetical protein
MGVEPIGDGITRHPPVLKTVRFTGIYALPLFIVNYLADPDRLASS